ncbi:MAG: hypothetical protein ABIZ80_25205, partial [Bryobacteraceae bacterium]
MLLRETHNSGPRPAPVVFSLVVHFALLGWVALGPRAVPERSKSLYQRVFEPNEKKLVWYRFSKKLPDISSSEPEPESKRTRAETLHPQTMVSRSKLPERGKQMVWVPAPELKVKQDLNAPNLMAFEKIEPPAPRPKPRMFTPPVAPAPGRQPIE